jgi:kynurenine formamidase
MGDSWMHRFIDLSHVIEDGMITYAGLPGPIIKDHLSREDSSGHYSDGTTFQIGISMRHFIDIQKVPIYQGLSCPSSRI